MTNNQMYQVCEYLQRDKYPNRSNLGYMTLSEGDIRDGFNLATFLIAQHLKSLPLDQMTGKQVEESLWDEFLHIQ